MLKKVQVSALTTILLLWSAFALAQTSPGTPAAPGAGTTTDTASGMNWLWIIIVLAIIAGAIWYFMKGRRRGTGV